MNGGTGKSGQGSRVPPVAIPAGVRKTIENIKEIASNHSDEEVYAMLRECSMDPNETCQKLLLQGFNGDYSLYFPLLCRYHLI
jgi:GBF-interacting protein 1 N-terminal